MSLEDIFKRYKLYIFVGLLAVISCIAILSATPIISNVSNPSRMWMMQFIYYILGGLLAFGIFKIGSETLYSHIKLLYWIFMILLIGLAVDHIAYTRILHFHIVPLANFVNGATSWYRLPFFSFQPSEFMKVILVMYLAIITKDYDDRVLIKTVESDLTYLLEVAKISLPPALLIYLQNDSGVMLILMASVFFVLISSGLNRNWFMFIFVSILFIVLLMIYLFIYQNGIFTSIIKGHTLDRIYGWLDPEGTTSSQGLQLWYSQLSYGSASWFGHGFKATIKAFPEAHTDFIFAVIATDFGFVGAIITILVIAGFDITLLKIGLDSDNVRDKAFTLGIMGCLLFQQIWNIAMILGLLPITGITLPFLSYGGSSLLSYMFALGIFIDMNYQNHIQKNRMY